MLLSVKIVLSEHGRYYSEMQLDAVKEKGGYSFMNDRFVTKLLEVSKYANDSSKKVYTFYTYCLEEDFGEAIEILDNFIKSYIKVTTDDTFVERFKNSLQGDIMNKNDFYISKGWK